MSNETVLRGKGFVVHRCAEQRAREVGAKRSADLHGLDRAACRSATPDVINELTERDPERSLEKTTVLDVASELKCGGPARAPHAEIGICLRALAENEGHGGQAQDVVDHRGAAEQPDVRRQRRLRANNAALALEALEQRGFLAAHVRAGAHPYFEIECVRGTRDAG